MKILFCGISVPENVEHQVKNISAAGNRFQNNMIQNLRKLGHDLTVISYVAMQIPQHLLKEFKNTSQQKYVIRKSTGTADTLKAIQECRENVKKLLPSCDAVIAYNAFYSFMFLPRMVRAAGKKSILILADYSGKECYSNVKGKMYATLQEKVIRKYTTVVGLSANIEKKLQKEQKFVLLEGGIDREFYNRFSLKQHKENEPITFMYSGLLSKVTGVDVLLDEMLNSKEKNVELWLSGKGELEEAVKAAEKDSRIKYLGHMKYAEYMEKLQNADVLINPRNMSLPENQNNFPSKIMDYLAVGKPIVSTKFIGWEKFQKEIIFYEDDLAEVMHKIYIRLNRDTEWQKQTFIQNRSRAEEYLWDHQIEKILE